VRLALTFLALLALAGSGYAETDEPEDASLIRAAREQTQVVFDLGRYLGAIVEMEAKGAKLALTQAQAKQILPILAELKASKRVTPEVAGKTLGKVQAILSPEQRKAVLPLAQQEGQGETGGGNGANRELFLSWSKGGPFNPFLSAKSATGQSFAALLASMERRARGA
jgi:hypothetical protein